MGRFDAARERTKQAAGAAVTRASETVEVAEAVARRAGLTKRNGQLSKGKLARKVLFAPTRTARTVLDAAAAEIKDRKSEADPGDEQSR